MHRGVSVAIDSFILQEFALVQALGTVWGRSQQSPCPVGPHVWRGNQTDDKQAHADKNVSVVGVVRKRTG